MHVHEAYLTPALASQHERSPHVTVVIPGYRGRMTIEACISSVLRAVARFDAEVILVESSGDGSAEFARQAFPGVTVISSNARMSAGEARNEGIRRARGQWVLCVDQDCIVPEDWVARLVCLLEQPGVGAAGGSIAVANARNASGWCVYFLEFMHHFPSRGRVREDNFLIGANSAWRRDVAPSGLFPDQTLGEDLLATESLRQRGLRVLYDPSVTVLHHNRQGWGEFLHYCRAMGEASAAAHVSIGGTPVELLMRMPLLAFGIPLVLLPIATLRLRAAPRGYLTRFIMLLPVCAWGHMVWAASFRRALIESRSRSERDRSPERTRTGTAPQTPVRSSGS